MTSFKIPQKLAGTIEENFVEAAGFLYVFPISTLKKIDEIVTAGQESFGALCKAMQIDNEKDFVCKDLSRTDFTDEGDYFEGANFSMAYLRKTIWNENTSIRRAVLFDADLRGATGLTEEMLAGAYINDGTHLPEDMSRYRINKMHRALHMPRICPETSPTGAFLSIDLPIGSFRMI